jgi:hypothetical protein
LLLLLFVGPPPPPWATPDGWWLTRTRDRIPWDFHERTLQDPMVVRGP